MKKFILKDKWYDACKWLLMKFTPASILLITTLGKIYNFDTENIKVLWKKAVVIDKQSNDSVNVDMKDLKCKLISNPPIVFAGTFDVHHQNQHYIIHFLQDMRTYINKKNGGMKVMQECHNVADLDSNLLYKFQKPERIPRK